MYHDPNVGLLSKDATQAVLVLGINNSLSPPTLSKSIDTTFNKTATCPNPTKTQFSLNSLLECFKFLDFT